MRADQDKIEKGAQMKGYGDAGVGSAATGEKGEQAGRGEKKGKGTRERSLFQASRRLKGLSAVNQDVRFRSLVKDLNIWNHSETED